jgi:hypothetical protein
VLKLSPRRLPLPLMPRRIALWATPTLLRPLPPCRLAAWSCPKPGLARSTRRPRSFPSCTLRLPETWLAAFSAASPSLTVAPRALPAATSNAPPAALLGSILQAQVRGPSILLALEPVVMPVLAEQALPARVPASAHGPALARRVLVVRLVRVAQRLPAKRRVRSVHQRAAVVDVPNIPRRRKAP